MWVIIALIWSASTAVAIDGIPRKAWPEKPVVERTDEREGRWTTRSMPDGGREVCYVPANERYERQCRPLVSN